MTDEDKKVELPVVVPWEELAPATLKRMLEDFISREGTDYGLTEYSMEQKLDSVMKQLRQGTVELVFEAGSETFNLIKRF